MYVKGIDERPPMMSGYPRREGREKGRSRKQVARQEDDRVEISPAAQALAREALDGAGEEGVGAKP